MGIYASINRTVESARYIITGMAILFFMWTVVDYWRARSDLVPKTLERLTYATEQRSENINAYMFSQIQQLEELAQQEEVQKLFVQLTESKSMWSGVSDKEDIKKNLQIVFASYKSVIDYTSILLVNHDGNILFTDNADPYKGINLRKEPYDITPLGRSFSRVVMSLTADIAEFAIDKTLNEITLYISVPLFSEGILKGVLIARINEDKIYSIFHDYAGLGVTGEIVIGKQRKDGVLFISKTRSESIAAFKKFLPFKQLSKLEALVPIQEAVLGNKAAGISVDYKNTEIIASWQYIPKLDWGIVAKMNLSEVEQTLLPKLFATYILGIFLVFILCFFFKLHIYFYRYIKLSINYIYRRVAGNRIFSRTLLWIVFSLVFIFLIFSINSFKRQTHIALENTKVLAQNKVAETKKRIGSIVTKTESLGKSLAYDLSLGRLKKEDILVRLKRDLYENDFIAGISLAYSPYAYESSKKLYAPYVFRKNSTIETINIESSYDYTQELAKKTAYNSFYFGALNEKKKWLLPLNEEISNTLVAPFSMPFFSKESKEKPVGVMTIFLSLAPIQRIVESVVIGATGHAYLLGSKGELLYHPRSDYVAGGKDLAREEANKRLLEIAKKGFIDEQHFEYYIDVTTNNKVWVHFSPIKVTDWQLGVRFLEKESEPEMETIRHYYMGILFGVFLLLMLMLALLTNITVSKNRTSRIIFLATTLPLLICQIGLFYIVQNTYRFDLQKQVTVYNAVDLNRFMYEMTELTDTVYELSPVYIPTGIELYSLSFNELQEVVISGFIWQKYHDDIHKGIERTIQFPQAIKNIDFTKKYEKKDGKITTIGWQFSAVLSQAFDYTKYPLDTKYIEIIMEHPDITKNILLVPDFGDYKKVDPHTLPGLQADFSLPGFNVEKTLFTFNKVPQKTTFGVEEYNSVSNQVELSFDIVLMREMLNALLVFFLPIFIVMFAIFVIFSSIEQGRIESLKALTAYTGLLFAIIFLHRTLRQQFQTGSVLYIEYFFFMTYITLLLLIIHSQLQKGKGGKQSIYQKIFKYFYTFFWQIQLIVSIVITIIIFY